MTPKVHKAGPMINGLQVCSLCGAVLTDYRGAQVPEGDANKPLKGWAVGAHVEVSYYGSARFSDLVETRVNCRDAFVASS